MRRLLGISTAIPLALVSTAALAAEKIGMPRDWQLGFQTPASSIMEEIERFHNWLLLPIITAITLLVLALLVYVMVRFNARSNPVPSKTTHNTAVEVVWTIVPVIILIVIAMPSFRLLFHESRIPPSDLTLKVVGHTWNWEYAYPDLGITDYFVNMKREEDLAPGEPRLLTADHEVVVPLGKVVRVIVTSADVIHAWAVPAFGVKIDAVPGRLNETWFKAEREGIFYGQCSELCGQDHAFMPIQIRVVSDAVFQQWAEAAKTSVEEAKKILAAADAAPQAEVAVAADAR